MIIKQIVPPQENERQEARKGKKGREGGRKQIGSVVCMRLTCNIFQCLATLSLMLTLVAEGVNVREFNVAFVQKYG